MAAQRVDRRVGRPCARPSSPAHSAQRRQARVTVKYDRRELQRRLDTEQWLEHALHELYRGQEQDKPEELNIDELLRLQTEQQKTLQTQRDSAGVQSQHRDVYSGAATEASRFTDSGRSSQQRHRSATTAHLLL
ncbi:hypothetical protein WMY93_028144 [Mugilogobius chulae]|uniref:Uncharacterized protein n=1 Tax=Mugilogobius chulae TaxID=88201 RepID=A0AAW0MPF1_9GOBI